MTKLKYLSSFTDRHGKTRWKFRRTGYYSKYIHGEYGSDEFLAEYMYAKSLSNRIVVGRDKVIPKSMEDLIIRYLNSADLACLADSTQTVYRRILDKFRVKYGHLPVGTMKRKHIREIMDKMQASPTSANRLLSLLSILLDIALDLEWVTINHARTIKKLELGPRGFRLGQIRN